MSFIIPKDKVVLIDLDGTIIDNNYQISDNELLKNAIEQAQSRGWILGLNSDTPLQALIPWQKSLGFNGPVIAERGAVVWDNGVKEIIDITSVEIFNKVKQELFKILSNKGLQFFYCDTLSLLQQQVDLGLISGEMALVNNMRECGIAFYIRNLSNTGEFMLCNNRLIEVVDALEPQLQKLLSNIPETELNLARDLNQDYSIFIASNALITKNVGANYLMQKNNWSEIGMIGNAMSDYMSEANVMHYAVGNATNDFKRVADYVCPSNLAAGVAEIVGQLS